MAQSMVLREYLVKLGWSLDDASYKKFNEAIAASARGIAKIGAGGRMQL